MTRENVNIFSTQDSTGRSEHAVAGMVDVLILTALQDELEGVLAFGESGAAGWQKETDRKGFRCYRRRLQPRRQDPRLGVL